MAREDQVDFKLAFLYDPKSTLSVFQQTQNQFNKLQITPTIRNIKVDPRSQKIIASTLVGDLDAKKLLNASREANKTSAAMKRLADATKKADAATLGFAERIGFSTNRLAAYLIPASAIFQLTRGFRAAAQSIVAIDRDITKLTQIMNNNATLANQTANDVLNVAAKFGVAGKEVLSVTTLLAQSGKLFKGSALLTTVEGLAQTQLGATFGSLESTTQGLIAALNQFNITGDDSIRVLDVVNKLAKEFAVASEDIFLAVSRGGKALQIGGGTIEQFAALTSAAKQLTGLSASTIGAGFNTIFLRLLRPESIKILDQFTGGTIRDAQGNLKDIVSILIEAGKAFRGLSAESKAFFAERLFGIRQGKIGIPLLEDISQGRGASITLDALDKAKNSAGSLARDTLDSFDRIDVILQRMGSTFEEVFGKISQDQGVKRFFLEVESVVKSLAKTLGIISPLIGPLLQLGTIGGLGLAGASVAKFSKGLSFLGAGQFGDVAKAHSRFGSQAIVNELSKSRRTQEAMANSMNQQERILSRATGVKSTAGFFNRELDLKSRLAKVERASDFLLTGVLATEAERGRGGRRSPAHRNIRKAMESAAITRSVLESQLSEIDPTRATFAGGKGQPDVFRFLTTQEAFKDQRKARRLLAIQNVRARVQGGEFNPKTSAGKQAILTELQRQGVPVALPQQRRSFGSPALRAGVGLSSLLAAGALGNRIQNSQESLVDDQGRLRTGFDDIRRGNQAKGIIGGALSGAAGGAALGLATFNPIVIGFTTAVGAATGAVSGFAEAANKARRDMSINILGATTEQEFSNAVNAAIDTQLNSFTNFITKSRPGLLNTQRAQAIASDEEIKKAVAKAFEDAPGKGREVLRNIVAEERRKGGSLSEIASRSQARFLQNFSDPRRANAILEEADGLGPALADTKDIIALVAEDFAHLRDMIVSVAKATQQEIDAKSESIEASRLGQSRLNNLFSLITGGSPDFATGLKTTSSTFQKGITGRGFTRIPELELSDNALIEQSGIAANIVRSIAEPLIAQAKKFARSGTLGEQEINQLQNFVLGSFPEEGLDIFRDSLNDFIAGNIANLQKLTTEDLVAASRSGVQPALDNFAKIIELNNERIDFEFSRLSDILSKNAKASELFSQLRGTQLGFNLNRFDRNAQLGFNRFDSLPALRQLHLGLGSTDIGLARSRLSLAEENSKKALQSDDFDERFAAQRNLSLAQENYNAVLENSSRRVDLLNREFGILIDRISETEGRLSALGGLGRGEFRDARRTLVGFNRTGIPDILGNATNIRQLGPDRFRDLSTKVGNIGDSRFDRLVQALNSIGLGGRASLLTQARSLSRNNALPENFRVDFQQFIDDISRTEEIDKQLQDIESNQLKAMQEVANNTKNMLNALTGFTPNALGSQVGTAGSQNQPTLNFDVDSIRNIADTKEEIKKAIVAFEDFSRKLSETGLNAVEVAGQIRIDGLSGVQDVAVAQASILGFIDVLLNTLDGSNPVEASFIEKLQTTKRTLESNK